ncbi:MAG: hypothetical protein RR272_03955 [Synergistaceae bacterium]
MEIKYIKLTEQNYTKVWEIFLDGFIDSHYFTAIKPDKKQRIEMFENIYAPAIKYCINQGTSYAITKDGEIAGYNLIAEYSEETKKQFEATFFDTFIQAGEKEVEVLRKRFEEINKKYPKISYFLIGVMSKKYRGMGLGKKINKYVVLKNENIPIMAELTSKEIIAIYDKIAPKRKIIKEQLTDTYVITTLLPEEVEK